MDKQSAYGELNDKELRPPANSHMGESPVRPSVFANIQTEIQRETLSQNHSAYTTPNPRPIETVRQLMFTVFIQFRSSLLCINK